jgi:HK97 family phage prohead protease
MENRHKRNFPLHIRNINDNGIVEGYASVFDVVDSYNDVIAPGAFNRTLKSWAASGRRIPVLWQHEMDNPIGVTLEATEDDKVLAVKAQLVT